MVPTPRPVGGWGPGDVISMWLHQWFNSDLINGEINLCSKKQIEWICFILNDEFGWVVHWLRIFKPFSIDSALSLQTFFSLFFPDRNSFPGCFLGWCRSFNLSQTRNVPHENYLRFASCDLCHVMWHNNEPHESKTEGHFKMLVY